MNGAVPHRETPPPALTWTHLLPAAAKYRCAHGPQWFAEQLCRHDGAQLSHTGIPVFWGQAGQVLSSDPAAVFINCANVPLRALQAAGFTYLRRFAALPNLQQARWFVPLDSAAISSASLSLYTPSRFLAKIKRGVARLAMRARLPIWYRDHVCIAQRSLPPIEAALNPLFNGQDVRWALSSGAPEGARNRKASALVIAEDGKMLAFVKLARSAIARGILANEADVLERLTQMPAACDAVPRLLYTGEIEDVSVLAQSPLEGAPAPVELTPAHQRFLASLRGQRSARAALTSTVADLPHRLEALPCRRPDLQEALHNLLPTLREFDVPLTMIHGDFAPWNLRLHAGRISAFDWEYGQPNGLPLIDEIHFRLQCGWLLENWTTGQATRCLAAMARHRPLGLEPRHVDAVATVYLLDALARLLAEGYAEDEEVIAWHQRLLAVFTPRHAPPVPWKEAAVA